MTPASRDHIVKRLTQLADLATRGWLEALPARVTNEFDHYSIRRQKLLIHDIHKEIELLLANYNPPTAVDEL